MGRALLRYLLDNLGQSRSSHGALEPSDRASSPSIAESTILFQPRLPTQPPLPNPHSLIPLQEDLALDERNDFLERDACGVDYPGIRRGLHGGDVACSVACVALVEVTEHGFECD